VFAHESIDDVETKQTNCGTPSKGEFVGAIIKEHMPDFGDKILLPYPSIFYLIEDHKMVCLMSINADTRSELRVIHITNTDHIDRIHLIPIWKFK
jgi:hypothetical protein